MNGRTMNTTQHDPFKNRREAAVAGYPVVDPADWRTDAIAASDAWRIELNSNDINDLHAAIGPFDREDIDLMPLGKESFALPHLAPKLTKMRADLIIWARFYPVARPASRCLR
jgi:hypothetical protein